MLDALMDVVTAIVSAIVELMVRLLSFALSSSWISAHATGLTRVFYGAMALSALHLFLGLVLGLAGGGGSALLSLMFNRWVMLASLCVLVLAFAGSLAVTRLGAVEQTGDTVVTQVASMVLALVIVFGGLSIWTAQAERHSLTERLCAQGQARVSDDIKAKGDKALGLAERLLKRDLRSKLPCRKAPAT